MSRRKIIVDRSLLEDAVKNSQSTSQAAASLGLTYQTFIRRCAEHNVAVTPNPSGKGRTAIERYGEAKAIKLAAEQSIRSKNLLFSAETRKKLSEAALKNIDEGKMPSKGLKGYHNGIWFDSSWELAYYLWMTEIKAIEPIRNKTIYFDYIDDDGFKRRTKPDFVLPNGELIEIKGYPNIHTSAKFEATKDRVTYLFKEDLSEALSYARTTYGNDFTKKFYADVVERYTR